MTSPPTMVGPATPGGGRAAAGIIVPAGAPAIGGAANTAPGGTPGGMGPEVGIRTGPREPTMGPDRMWGPGGIARLGGKLIPGGKAKGGGGGAGAILAGFYPRWSSSGSLTPL